MSVQSHVESLSKLTVLEMSELVKALEETWGVSAAAPAAVVAAAPGGEAPAEAAAQTEFKIVLKALADASKKIAVIKEVRAITGLGLGEAKALVEGAPKDLKEGLSKEDAEKIKKQLEDAGATIETV